MAEPQKLSKLCNLQRQGLSHRRHDLGQYGQQQTFSLVLLAFSTLPWDKTSTLTFMGHVVLPITTPTLPTEHPISKPCRKVNLLVARVDGSLTRFEESKK
jgi:hypothetical protein